MEAILENLMRFIGAPSAVVVYAPFAYLLLTKGSDIYNGNKENVLSRFIGGCLLALGVYLLLLSMWIFLPWAWHKLLCMNVSCRWSLYSNCCRPY